MFKSNLKQLLTYGIGSVAQSALGFLLLPLYIQLLSPAEYGVITVLLTLNNLIGLVAGAGVLSGLSRLFYELDVSNRRELSGTIIIWMITSSLGLALIINVISNSLSFLLFNSNSFKNEIQIASYLIFLIPFQASLNNIMRLERHAGGFIAVSLIGFLSDFLLKFFLIGWAGQGVDGYLISSVISQVFMILGSIFVLRHDVIFMFRYKMLLNALTLGFPYIFSGLAMWVLEISDRLILNAYLGADAVGIYALANKFANIFNILLLGPITLFWTPFIFSYAAEHGESSMRRILGKAFTIWAILGIGLLLCISSGSADIIRLFTRYKVYNEAAILIPYLSLAPFLYMMAHLAGVAILQSKQVRYSSYAMSVAAAVNIALNLLLVSRFSLFGVTAATVIGYLVLFGLLFYWAQHLFHVSYNWKNGIKILSCGMVALAFPSFINIEAPIISFMIKEIVGIVIFLITLRLVGCLNTYNFKKMRDLVNGLLVSRV
jgi:O-antigen/teichoic acid export membrane protein